MPSHWKAQLILSAMAGVTSLHCELMKCSFATPRILHSPRLQLKELDETNFAEAIAAVEGLAVVIFFAQRCRTCRAVKPIVERMASKMSAEPAFRTVRFFKVDFKENKQLFKHEKATVLPVVHFYSRSLGHVSLHQFTLVASRAAATFRDEVTRYAGESGQLAMLESADRPNDEHLPMETPAVVASPKALPRPCLTEEEAKARWLASLEEEPSWLRR